MSRAKAEADNWPLMIVLIALLGGGALSSFHVVDKQRQALGGSAELSYLPEGGYLKVAVLGYRHIVADLIWLKVVQGLSGRQQTRERYLGAYHAADVLTDLDPQFVHAYQYTGTVLGVVAGLVNESIALLTKGVRHNPTAWQLSFILGYDYYYELQDPASAAKHFRTASLQPGAPPWLAGLAARMAVEANDPSAALEFLQRLYIQANDEQFRNGVAERIRDVMAERDIRELERAVGLYRERSGSLPRTLDDLVSSGILAKIPEEPFGGRYELSLKDGSVKSSLMRERLRVYRR